MKLWRIFAPRRNAGRSCRVERRPPDWGAPPSGLRASRRSTVPPPRNAERWNGCKPLHFGKTNRTQGRRAAPWQSGFGETNPPGRNRQDEDNKANRRNKPNRQKRNTVESGTGECGTDAALAVNPATPPPYGDISGRDTRPTRPAGTSPVAAERCTRSARRSWAAGRKRSTAAWRARRLWPAD